MEVMHERNAHPLDLAAIEAPTNGSNLFLVERSNKNTIPIIRIS